MAHILTHTYHYTTHHNRTGEVGPMVRRIRPRAVIGSNGMESLAHELVHVPRLEKLDLNNMVRTCLVAGWLALGFGLWVEGRPLI